MKTSLRALTIGVAILTFVGMSQSATAANLWIDTFEFSYQNAAITFSVTYRNADAEGVSNTVRLRLTAQATEDGAEEIILSETTADGVPGLEEITTEHIQTFNQVPADGTYQVFMVLDEADGDDFIERHRVPAAEEFDVNAGAQEQAARRRVAASIPCGSLFVPYTIATFLALLTVRMLVRRHR